MSQSDKMMQSRIKYKRNGLWFPWGSWSRPYLATDAMFMILHYESTRITIHWKKPDGFYQETKAQYRLARPE